jgi:glycosyltransferase involved in cell wall biosynthesis
VATEPSPRLKLCFVVQRYGLEVAGGSELHCRWLAGRLKAHHDVRVATTCALDYLEWRNHYPPGATRVDGIPVQRFPVRRPRDAHRFALISDLVFHETHTPEDERSWVRENGPDCPDLVKALRTMKDVDLFIFYAYRYYQTFFGLPTVQARAVLVPTAEEDPAIELPVFASLFRAPRGLIYLTPEEKALVEGVSGNSALPSVVVGSGINVPVDRQALSPQIRGQVPERYLLYVGRIDRNKGVDRLFEYYERLQDEWPDVPPLVLVGRPALDIPRDPKVIPLGFVSEEEKFTLLEGAAVLVMPSRYESLSVIVLEAWAMGRPVLVNAECRVLEGQCVRSGGGLFYRGYSEFGAALRRIVSDRELQVRLGASGRRYVQAEYDWSVVEQRTDAFLRSLSAP